MILLAAPRDQALCVDERHESILNTKNTAVLDALRKIRKAESSSPDAARLLRLDRQIEKLQRKICLGSEPSI